MESKFVLLTIIGLLSIFSTFARLGDSRTLLTNAVGTLVWTNKTIVGPVNTMNTFSSSLSIYNNMSAVGANGQGGTGAVYIMHLDTETDTWTTNPPIVGPTAGEAFGTSTSLANDFLAVGASQYNNSAGAVYLYATADGGTSWTQTQILTPTIIEPAINFGTAVAFAGNTLFVGAPNANGGAGSVYIFTYASQTWAQQGILKGNDTVKLAAFGQSLSAEPTVLAVGAPQDNFNKLGLVYVFRPSTNPTAVAGWDLVQTLSPVATNAQGRYGFAVATQNGVLIAGDPTNNNAYLYEYSQTQHGPMFTLAASLSGGLDFGVSVALSITSYMNLAMVGCAGTANAYVYFLDQNVWMLQQKLTGPEGSSMGQTVAILNNTALAGAPNYGLTTETGAIWAFSGRLTTFAPTMAPVPAAPTPAPSLPPTTMSNWAQTGVVSMDPTYEFGNSIAVDNSQYPVYHVAIGAPLVPGTTSGSAGSVSVWTASSSTSGWTQYGNIVTGAVADNLLGISVALYGNVLIAGATGYLSGQGAAYYYLLTGGSTWTQQAVITASDGASGDNFGCSLALLDANILFVGASDAGASSEGQVYVYLLVSGNWVQQQVLKNGIASSQFGVSVSAYGSVSTGLVAIGAPSAVTGASKGAVYTYTISGGVVTLSSTVNNPVTTTSTGFGKSVAVGIVSGGNFLVAGNPAASVGSVSAGGAVYAFTLTSTGVVGATATVITAGDANNNAAFGSSLAWSLSSGADNSIIVGAPFAQGTGRAYIFSLAVSTIVAAVQVAELVYSPLSSTSSFATAVGAGNDIAVVGAPGYSNAYFFGQVYTPLNDDSTDSQNGALSPGATAGVVIGVLAGVGIAITVGYFYFIKPRSSYNSPLTRPVLSPMSPGNSL